jgi:catechol 2,3-dioxygenase-like lactoylglutathione lyase family enzyme
MIPLRGLRHLALNVSDMARARAFYEGLLGMKVVWEPDPKNVYLSSGCDNLALHTTEAKKERRETVLDHFGFLVGGIEEVKEWEGRMREAGVRIVHPFKVHRDGSVSFYMADPEGNVIQILYEPNLSPQRFGATPPP